MEGCYVYWPDKEDSESNVPKGTIKFFKHDSVPEGYSPASALVNQDGFIEELRGYVTSAKVTVDMDSGEAWQVFGGVFSRIGGATHHRPFFLKYLQNAFDVHFSSGINHLEARVGVDAKYFDLNGTIWSGRDMVLTNLEALETWKSSSPSRANFTYKLIVASSRGKSTEKFMEDLEAAIALRKEFPDFVVGFDAVGAEDWGHRWLDYVEDFLTANDEVQELGLTLPLFLHSGESQDGNDTNMIDAVLLDCPRIGHGLNDAFYFPAVRDELKTKGTVVEVNPISNQVLRYVGSLESHPAASLAFDGVNIVIASDDPFIFGYTGLTVDWWAVAMAWYLDLRSLKTLAKNSLLFSALNKTEKETALEQWEREWDKYMALFAQTATAAVV